MNKYIKVILVVAVVAVLALGGAAFAFAQTEAPPAQSECGGPGGPHGPQLLDRDERDAVIATALGMTVEELRAEFEAGKRLPEIAEAQGVDLATVQDAIQAAKEEALTQAVADGTITQEQAEAIRQRWAERAEQIANGERPGRPHGPRNGFGGPNGQPPQGTATPSDN